MFPRLILLPWDPGFYDILNGTPPPGEQNPFIVRNPVTGLNEWRKDLDSLYKIVESDDYLQWEEDALYADPEPKQTEETEEGELYLLVPDYY